MDLASGQNNAVAETTATFLRSAVAAATTEGAEGTVEVVDGGERRTLSLPADIARRLARPPSP